jgi:hypothetical protein
MIDEAFIKIILQKGGEAKEKVRSEFSDLSLQETVNRESRGNWYYHFK